MIALVINPTAGTGHAERVGREIVSILEEKKADFITLFTTHAGEGEDLARQAAAQGAETVYAVGGDGTVLEVARGLRGTGAALGIIPAGTGNDVIKTLGIPKDPREALAYQLERAPRALDAMAVNGSLSLNVAGTGFDVCVLDHAEKAKKFVRGLLPYLWGVLCTIVSYRGREMRVTIDGDSFVKKDARHLRRQRPLHRRRHSPWCPWPSRTTGCLPSSQSTICPTGKCPSSLLKLLKGRVLKIPGAVARTCRRLEIACEGMRVNVDGEISPHEPRRDRNSAARTAGQVVTRGNPSFRKRKGSPWTPSEGNRLRLRARGWGRMGEGRDEEKREYEQRTGVCPGRARRRADRVGISFRVVQLWAAGGSSGAARLDEVLLTHHAELCFVSNSSA